MEEVFSPSGTTALDHSFIIRSDSDEQPSASVQMSITSDKAKGSCFLRFSPAKHLGGLDRCCSI